MGRRCIHLHALLLPDNLHFHNRFVAAQPPRNARARAHLGRYVIPTAFLSTNALILWKKVSPRLPPSPLDALLNAPRLNTAIRLCPPPHPLYIIVGHRVAQHPARSSTTPSVPVAASSTDGTSP
ncbi:hypothetical protein K438DRAFT_1199435 [Mycena galopus ATCC 62051]|nr:hypothetical protein K438DRAFT_1199435 [Mycena galopus ATCC 62051]